MFTTITFASAGVHEIRNQAIMLDILAF